MKEQESPTVRDLAPMLATLGSVDRLTHTDWAFEGKFDGYRLLLEADHGRMCLQSRSGRDVTGEYPGLQSVVDALADHHAILDGEVVALDKAGVPSFSEMQNRARATRIEFWAFDVLQLDGRPLLRARYRDRRRVLEALAADRDELIVPELLSGDGPDALAYSRKRGWEGVVAKRWDSTYQPGRRSRSWIKDKNWNSQEIVIGGWREGTGRTDQPDRRVDDGHPRQGRRCGSSAASVPASRRRNSDGSRTSSRRCAPTNLLSPSHFPGRTPKG